MYDTRAGRVLSRDAIVLQHSVLACNDIDIELLFGFFRYID